MAEFTHYVGLDVSKATIAMAVARGREEPVPLGVVAHDRAVVRRRLAALGPPSATLVAYEAGPTGYGLARALQADGFQCQVVAPSKTPRRAGDRVKTDRRDALTLARYLRSGDLVAVRIPDEGVEALRDLVRARADAKKAETVARHHLDKLLLRKDRIYPGKSHWTGLHHEWLQQQRFEHPALQAVLADHLHAVLEAGVRVERLTADIERHVQASPLMPLVIALQALRGVQLVTAATLACELGDLRRFSHPRQLMSFVGLVPSESSSGERVRRGAITRTGNGHVRRVLVEAAWAYRTAPQLSRTIKARQEHVSHAVRRIAWEAQRRLHGRWRRLAGRGKDHRRTIIAIARELAAFVWAIGQERELLATSTT
jgi:transposase